MSTETITTAMPCFGRRKILCDEEFVTSENVESILSDALLVHQNNSLECNYLYNYRRGLQPVLNRTKTIRPEICNKVVENRADEIVSFKTGYLCGEPLQYVSRGNTDAISNGIQKLNDYMLLCGKPALDKDLAEWMYTCGTGYRMVLPNSFFIDSTDLSEDDAPFKIATLDPRFSFVVYYSGLVEKPLMGVKYIYKEDEGTTVYSVFTATQYFELTADGNGETRIDKTQRRAFKAVPIIEYPLNSARLGAFEVVLPILDAVNQVESNRIDGIEQFIQSLLIFYNCDIDDDAAEVLREAGLIKLKSVGDNKADVKEIAEALDQDQTQTLVDYMYQAVLEIVGMPNRNGGSSTSDTGAATIVRDGWATAEARAKMDELSFKESERQFLKAVLRIMRDTVETPLGLADIDTKFTRRNYENVQTKAQVLCEMLGCDKIAPELAFTYCGMFSDPQDAAKMSAEYYEGVKAEAAAAQEETPDNTTGDGGAVA